MGGEGAHRRWHARWIWAPTELRPAGRFLSLPVMGTGEEHALFRRTFELAAVPERAPARVTADSRYVLFANGREVCRGPVRSDPTQLRYDAPDLAPFLRPGRNTLAIHARYYGEPTPWWAPAPPSLGLGRRGALAFELDLGSAGWLGSDAGWRALRCDAFTPVPRSGASPLPALDVDAARLPPGFEQPEFDDGTWPAAEELAPLALGGDLRTPEPPSAPYGALLPRPIPFLEGAVREPALVRAWRVAARPAEAPPPAAVFADEARPALAEEPAPGALPLTVRGEGTRLVLLDFGEVVAGLVRLEVSAPAGTEIEIGVRETEAPPPGGGLAPTSSAGIRYRARGHDDTLESFDPVGLRYALVAVRGTGEPVTLRRLSVREHLFPEAPGGEFRCSDPLLERIHRVGLRTVALNAHDAYLDCPTREQRAWTGDAVVHQMVHLATHPDWSLARFNTEMALAPRADGLLPMAAAGDLAGSGATIPEWSLHWIRSVWNLWRYTGDRELVRRALPVAERVLTWFLPCRGAHGLLCHVPQWVLVDWAALHLADTSSVLNAQWARGLLEFAEMSEWLGDGGRARFARSLHAELREAFERFWDEERGVYVDHLVAGERRAPMSQHAGAAALLAGLVPTERVERVLTGILDRFPLVRRTWVERGGTGYLVTGPPEPHWDVEREMVAAQPFFRYVVHDAVAAAGRADRIPSLCRDWGIFLDRGETTWPELWEGGTRCHGWSSTPTRDLVTRTLGIEPAEPGFGVARVAPRLGGLDWAAGSAPTPFGFLRVRASRESVEIESPVPVLLDLPDRPAEKLPAGSHRVSGPRRAP